MGAFIRNCYLHLVPTQGNAYRPRLLEGRWLLFFLAVVLTTEGIFFASVSVPKMHLLAAVVPGEVVAFTNSERLELGEQSLMVNPYLTGAAQAKANDMAAKGYFSHTSPDGATPWAWIIAAGYEYQYAGENLAVRFDNSAEVVSAWMASPSHRANIVKQEYMEIGVGTAEGEYKGTPATFVVQYFGAPFAAVGEREAPTGQPVSARTVANALPAATTNITQSSIQQFMRAVTDNPQAIAFALGVIAGMLFLVVLVGVGRHPQVQPVGMLAGGLVVGGLALLFIILNAQVLEAPDTEQAAALGQFQQVPGIIGEGAATKLWIVQ